MSVSATCEHVFVAVMECAGVQLGDVRAVTESLRGLVAALEPDVVFVFDAPELLAAFVELETLAAAGKVLLARRMEDACTWQGQGFRSAADQLASLSGTSVTAAKGLLDTSRRIEDLPLTAGVLRSGKLSAAKVEAVAAAAEIAPGAEAGLLDSAVRAPLAQVREECLRARAVDRDATHARIHRERGARDYTDGEGKWNFHAFGTPQDGARWRAAHGPIVDQMFKTARAQGRTETHDACAFDAFIALADRGTRTCETGNDTKNKRTPARFLGLIRVDHQALRHGAVDSDETCEIAGLGPIPAGVARELLGDAILKLVITKGTDVANVTHLGRSVTVAQQVALWWQSPCCTVEGCTRTRHLENDHRDEWANTHHTRLDETDPLCNHHHDLKTHDHWALVPGAGKRDMVPPHDPRHPTTAHHRRRDAGRRDRAP